MSQDLAKGDSAGDRLMAQFITTDYGPDFHDMLLRTQVQQWTRMHGEAYQLLACTVKRLNMKSLSESGV
eukprot:6035997-Amphidinium_carterae.1